MGWRFIIQPNGLLARFSTVVDDFTHYDMTEAEALAVAVDELDCWKRTAAEKIAAAHREPARFDEAIETVRTVHGEDEARKRLNELSQPSPHTAPPTS